MYMQATIKMHLRVTIFKLNLIYKYQSTQVTDAEQKARNELYE